MDYWGVPAPREKGDSEGPKRGIMAILGPPFLCIFLKELDPFWTLFGPFLVLFSTFSPYGTPLGHLPLYCPLIWTLLGTLPGPQKGGPKTAIWDPF